MGMDTTGESPWIQRIGKVGQYLSHGDLAGLAVEVQRFVTWKQSQGRKTRASRTTSGDEERGTSPARSGTEAGFWDEFDVDLGRKVSWGTPADFGGWALQKMCDGRHQDIMDIVIDMMKVSRTQPLRGLVLGCGDMVAEHTMFIHPKLPFGEVDAYDVSPQSIERGRQLTDEKGLKVNYYVADVNQLELEPDQYSLVVVFHSFHHLEQVDRVAWQINQSLLPGGVFYTFDYIGPRKLQFTERQLSYAQSLLQLFPPHYRRELDGKTRQRVQSVSPDSISPDEAICSDQILSAIARNLDVVWQYNWGGLLYPLLEGIAFNFISSSEDQAFLKFLFGLDYALCQSGEIEPNFTITLAAKKH